MFDYSTLLRAHRLEYGQTLDLELGSLHLWIHRGLQDWHLAHESGTTGMDERHALRIGTVPFDSERDWSRLILDDNINEVHLKPQMPDRPIIVRPEMPICLMPKQTVQLFIGVPIWLSLVFGKRRDEVIEVPSMVLSNSWFGPFTEGELCYAMKTRAKLNQAELKPSAHRAVFALQIRNASPEKLNFKRLCIRPQYLHIFQGATRLWTNEGRVSYRGEDNWSRIVYAAGAPKYDQAELMVGAARDSMKRGNLLNTFDTFKQRVDI